MVLNPRCEIWKYFDNIVEEGVAVCKLCKQRLKNERSFSLRKHILKLHNPKSEIWKYYDNVVDECVAVCRICSKRVRNNRYFNLTLHLKQHDIIVEVENENLTKNDLKSEDGRNELNTVTKPEERSRENLYITMEEKTLVEAVMGLVVDEGVTPQLFASKNMQALLSPICDAISKQEDIKFNVDELQSETVVHSIANYIREDFGNDLRWRLLSLKIDMDRNSDLNNTFYVSVQFVNDTQVENRILGIIILDDHQQLSGECIMNILSKFNIDPQQIVSASWDNAKAKFNDSVPNSDYLQEIQQFERNTDIHVGEVKVERYIGVIAQLCVLDIFKNPSIFQLFKECRNLTKFINDKPDIFHKAFKQNNLNIPQLDSPWKWGSTFAMMNDLRDAQDVLENIKYEQPDCQEERCYLNDNLKSFIEAFCKTVNILQKSAKRFYNSEIIYGDFYAQWLKCKLVTEKLFAANSKEGTILAVVSSELLKSIENRSEELLNQDHFKACLYLDPRFQHTLNMPEKMFALEYLKQLWHRSKIFNPLLVDPVSEMGEETHPPPENFDDDGDAFLNEFLYQSVKETSSTGIYKKLEDLRLPFKMVDTNILSFWKDLQSSEPEIYTLSTICFAIPATQNYNKFIVPHRHPFSNTSNVSPTLKENIEFIRLNQHLLDKAISVLGPFREVCSSETELTKNIIAT